MASAALEARIQDLSSNSWASFGNVFTQNVVQTVRKVEEGDTNFNTYYYSLDDDNIATRVGGMQFLISEQGEASMSFSAVDQSGQQVNLLDMSPSGIQISGSLTVLGDGIEFNSPNLEVSDESLTLASEALLASDIDQGGFILGTDASGKKTFLYSLAEDSWLTNASIDLEAGHALTIGTDKVVLNEVGLTIGEEVSVSATGIQLGDTISLTAASGLNINESVKLTSSALTIGDVLPVVLDSSGLLVGNTIALNSGGLVAGDVSLDSQGLVIGTDIALSVSNGLTISDSVSLTTDSLTLGSTGGAVLDDTSLQLGESVLLNQTGLHFAGASAAIVFGPASEWKISYDDASHNLVFEFLDTSTGLYTKKMELKSAA